MLESIVHWYYRLPPYAWWTLNLLFAVTAIFSIGLLAFGMIVNNGEMSEDDAPKNFKQFVRAIFTLGVFTSLFLLPIWFLVSRH